MASSSSAQLAQHPLPAALAQLFADLAASSSSNPQSLKELPDNLGWDEYGNFFVESNKLSDVEMGDERRWAVRSAPAAGHCHRQMSHPSKHIDP
eukprot:TRINITY_DN6756_c0_g1_i2.p3 TRINITY_DN6756_c0_g1~~TRINITY_DN6756_c0_g1_i2.p3  ORF type:complete len:104 (-),score=10.28 TRINITY_DN6756_c0_g1_i2:163-444(-)